MKDGHGEKLVLYGGGVRMLWAQFFSLKHKNMMSFDTKHKMFQKQIVKKSCGLRGRARNLDEEIIEEEYESTCKIIGGVL